ncbi:SoxR reducing system protein RseC, partial [Dysosmobacter welbionis]
MVILPNSSDCVDAFSRHSNSFGGLRRLYSPLFAKRPPSGSPDGGLFSDLFFFQGQRLFAEHGQKRLPLHGLMLQQIGRHGLQLVAVVVQDPFAAVIGIRHQALDLLVDLGGHRLGIAAALGHGAADEHLVVAGLEGY